MRTSKTIFMYGVKTWRTRQDIIKQRNGSKKTSAILGSTVVKLRWRLPNASSTFVLLEFRNPRTCPEYVVDNRYLFIKQCGKSREFYEFVIPISSFILFGEIFCTWLLCYHSVLQMRDHIRRIITHL
jgi:hypothetical protein